MSPANCCKASENIGDGVTGGGDEGNARANSHDGADESLKRVFTIVNKRGLHARAAAKFVKCVEQFDAQITVTREGYSVGGTSIMGLMMLAAANGSEIEVVAEGSEATLAIEALEALIADKFGEGE